MIKIINSIYFVSGVAFAVFAIKSLQKYGLDPVIILIIVSVIWIMSFFILTALHYNNKNVRK